MCLFGNFFWFLLSTNIYNHFVPVSCCSTKTDGSTGFPLQIYRNKKRCQNWQYGPPTFQNGSHNDAVYYRVN
ncbi:unnamed protein product [Schistosoma turkestanicum]|nr:unnamed protein product [Schistosoma turkestanicum]